jgi:hypothetical protein
MCGVRLKDWVSSSVELNVLTDEEEVIVIVECVMYWGDLAILNEKTKIIGCPLADAWKWQGQRAEPGQKDMQAMCDYKLNRTWNNNNSKAQDLFT